MAECQHCGFVSRWHGSAYVCGRCREVHGISDRLTREEQRADLFYRHPDAYIGLNRIARCCYGNSAPYREWFDAAFGEPATDEEYLRPFEVWEDDKGRFRAERHREDPFQTKSIVHEGGGVFRSLEDADRGT